MKEGIQATHIPRNPKFLAKSAEKVYFYEDDRVLALDDSASGKRIFEKDLALEPQIKQVLFVKNFLVIMTLHRILLYDKDTLEATALSYIETEEEEDLINVKQISKNRFLTERDSTLSLIEI